MKKKLFLILSTCLLVATCISLVACDDGSEVNTSHVHELKKVEAVEATCTEDGNSEYYACECSRFFADEKGEQQIVENSWIIPATGHDYKAVEYYDSDNLYIKKQVCAHDASHVEDNVSVALTAQNLNSVINDADIEKRNWQDYNLLLKGYYDQITLEKAGKTNEGDGSSANPNVYRRNIRNFVLDGNGETIIDGINIDAINSGVVYNPTYYIRTYINIETLIVKDLTLTDIFYVSGNVNIENVIFENVTFHMLPDARFSASSAIRFIAQNGNIGNLTIKGCSFKDLGKMSHAILFDARTTDDVNITVEDCSFANFTNNAIQIAGSGSTFTGNITFKNNVVTNTGDRPFRIANVGVGATIIITGNVFDKASDDEGEMAKASSLAVGATVVISDNYWGVKDGATGEVKGMVVSGGDTIYDVNPKASIN